MYKHETFAVISISAQNPTESQPLKEPFPNSMFKLIKQSYHDIVLDIKFGTFKRNFVFIFSNTAMFLQQSNKEFQSCRLS